MNEFLYTYGLPIAFGFIGLAGLVLGSAHAIYLGRGWQDYDELQHQQDLAVARQDAEEAEANARHAALEKTLWNK